MTEKLETKNHIFYIDGTKLMVQYLNENRTISLNDLDIEIIGISSEERKHAITIITKSSIQKLKYQVSDTLEVIGYVFETMVETLAAFNFIIFWLDKLRTLKQEKEMNATN